MKRELLGFVFAHTDNCPMCSTAEFCQEGRELIQRAKEIVVQCFVPDAAIETPKAKA